MSSLWDAPASPGFSPQAGFANPWGSAGGSSGGQQPSTPPQAAPPSGGGSGATPGTFNINPADPLGSAQKVGSESGDFLGGLKDALFGTSGADPQGHHGGIFGLGDTFTGSLLRGATETAAGIGGAVLGVGKGALDVVGGALERVPSNVFNLGQPDVQDATLRSEFNSLPDESPIKQAAQAAMDKEHGLLNTGWFDNDGSTMSRAVREYQTDLTSQAQHPALYQGLISTPGSLADTITNLFGVLGIAQRTAERGLAGASNPFGKNRIEEIMAVGSGEAPGFGMGSNDTWKNPDGTTSKLSPLEAMVFAKVSKGEWSQQDAMDFMASRSSGLSHSAVLQIAGSFLSDPLQLASLGAASIAKLGVTGAELVTNMAHADVVLRAAQDTYDAASGLAKVEAATKLAEATSQVAMARTATIIEKGTAAAKPVYSLPGKLISRLGESQGVSQGVADFGRAYLALEDTALGRSAKIIRTIIDPMHSFSLHGGSDSTVDLLSSMASEAQAAGYGRMNHIDLLGRLHDNVSPAAFDQFVDDFAVYSTKQTRDVVANEHRAAILSAGLGDRLASVSPGHAPADLMDAMMGGHRRDILDSITEAANRNRIRTWDASALDDLAGRMQKFYGHKTEGEWRQFIDELNPDQRSMLHAATYGKANQVLLDAVDVARREGSGMSDLLHRMVLLNQHTLTKQGAGGIIDRIGDAGTDLEKATAEVKAALLEYPDLRFFTFNDTAPGPSIDRFVNTLKGMQERLAMQVTNEEALTLHAKLADLQQTMKGSFTLGFRPEDEYLWGLERSNATGGLYAPIGPVWTDLVGLADAGQGYRPGHYLQLNFRGQPILQSGSMAANLARAPFKAVDYINVMGQVMRQRVSGTMISDAARGKFIANGIADHDLTKGEAKAIFDRLTEAAGDRANVSGPRGLEAGEMKRIIADLVPKRLARQINERDILKLVLDAYDGDVRFIGATQKLSAHLKAVAGNLTGVNYLGQIAESLYPTIKFRLNPIFQTQEKIEGWILNVQRGAQAAAGTTMSPSDVVTQRNLENMVNSSLVRMGDIDAPDFYKGTLHGKALDSAAAQPGSRLRAALTEAMNVQGVKQINMLRTFRHGFGKELKGAWESHSPGVWDEMKADAQLRANHLISEDDFAVQVMGEHLLGNDVVVQRIINKLGGADFKADFRVAISPGQWAAPLDMGEMRRLDMAEMVQSLGFTGARGRVMKDEGDIRAAIAAGDVKLEDVSQALLSYGADPDYVRRVENALQFSWEGFWDTVAKRFNLDQGPGGRKLQQLALEDMIAASAKMRGLSPADFMSQVYWPTVRGGTEGAVGSLGSAVDLLHQPKTAAQAGLAELAAPIGPMGEALGTHEDLVRQLSQVFTAHLDPSTKRALLMEFKPELREAIRRGELRLDGEALDAAWADGGDEGLFRSIMDGASATEGDIFEAGLPTNRVEYEQQYPSRTYTLKDDGGSGGEDYNVVQVIGDGVEAMPPELRREVIGAIARVQAQLPELAIGHINTMDMEHGVMGFTVGTEVGTPSIFLSERYFKADHKARWAELHDYEEAHRFDTHYPSVHIGTDQPRESVMGTTYTAGSTPQQVVYHETAHVMDMHMRSTGIYPGKTAFLHPDAAKPVAGSKRFKAYRDWVDKEFDGSPAQLLVSEYGTKTLDESMAELGSLLLDPHPDMSRFARVKAPPRGIDEPMHGPQSVQEALDQVREILHENGMLKELPQATMNPDIIRAHRQFGKWTEGAVNQGLLRGSQGAFSGILTRIGRIATEGAVPYDLTQGRLIAAATEVMQRKWADAYRLQYFAQKRTMFERSINHPLFGIYPASYMWGKIMPEMVRFIASEPFGVRTGAMAYSMHDVLQAVSAQREVDPEFDKLVQKLGTSQAMWFLGYLLPSVPWDVGASMPSWMRDLAKQGLASNASVAAGGTAVQPDLMRSILKQGDVIDPRRPFKQVQSVGRELDQFMNPTPPSTASQPIPEGTSVKGAQLGPTLEEQLQLLQGALSQP